jgi:competence protein ComFC
MFTDYEDVAKLTIKDFKFNYKREAARNMASAIEIVLPHYSGSPIITYVPTAGSHVRERGFDGTALIAKNLAKIRGYKIKPMLIKLNSNQQKGVGRKERLAQLKGSFGVINFDVVRGAEILLVDDVVTTGATIEECCRMLLKSGAKSVDVAVFARTPL